MRENSTWRAQAGWRTSLTLYERRADIVYNGLNGTIMSHTFQDEARKPVDISATELLHVWDTVLGPVNKSTDFGIDLQLLGLGSNKPILPLSIWQYFQGLEDLSKKDLRANRRAIGGLQSLLASGIYHCQAKDFVELRRLLLSVQNSNLSNLGQDIISLFPEVEADTKFYPAAMRYNLRVGRRSLLAYVVISAVTLILCFAALLVATCTEVGRKVCDMTPFPSLNLMCDCRVGSQVDSRGLSDNSFVHADLHSLHDLKTGEKLLKASEWHVTLWDEEAMIRYWTSESRLEPVMVPQSCRRDHISSESHSRPVERRTDGNMGGLGGPESCCASESDRWAQAVRPQCTEYRLVGRLNGLSTAVS